MNFQIIKKATGKASQYAKYVVELYEKRDGITGPVEDALNLLGKDSAKLKENKIKDEILLCFEIDPYPSDYELNSITGEAIKILDENGLKYVILSGKDKVGRAISDFEQLKHPKNIKLIIKITSIQLDPNNDNQADEDFVNLLRRAIRIASEKGVRTGIHFGPGSDPMLSLQLVYGLYSVVDMWKVGDRTYEPSTVVRSKWKRFKEDAKSKKLFHNLGPPKSLNKYKINTISGDPRLLLITPHGVATFPKDDINTDELTLKIAEKLKCSVIVNDVISRLYLDFNNVKEAQKHAKFIPDIKRVLKIPGPTLVVWIHGIDDNNLKKEIRKSRDVQCLIGYGQGQPNRFTAEKKTVDDMIRLFKDNSIIAHVARDGSNYCGHSTFLMNQWFRLKGHKLTDVQSVQLEFKLKGIRKPKDLDKASQNIANALSQLVDFKYHVEQQPTETVESEQSAEEIPAQSKTESSNNLPSIVKKEPEDPLVAKAFVDLKEIFQRHFHGAMLEAGQYLIKTFYKGNSRAAFAKNKTKEQPKSLKKLIEKIQQNSNSPSENVPSTVWVYNAVNLAAHEAICEIEGLQTFVILGHSHKLQLLHVPKLKQIEKDKFDEAIGPAFQEKERLARVAIEKKLSVRDFKAYIKEQHPVASGTIDLTKLPPLDELRQRESKELSRLRNLAKRKIDEYQKKIDEYQKMRGSYNEAFHTLSDVLAEKEAAQTGEMLLPKTVKVIPDYGVKTKTIGMPISSESRLKNPGINRYLLISALQKSIRWCEVNESRYFAREYMNMGYPGGVFKRLILIAAEDVGLADPSLVEYERRCSDRFESLIKEREIKKRDAYENSDLCEIVDRAVIAAAISFKSRLLPQLSFATLFNIYQNEDFRKNLPEYLDRFVEALGKRDEKQALYNAYVAGIFLNSMDKILALIQKHSGMRNKDLIQKWVEEYKRNNELLMLAGSVALLCRDLQNPHGEYKDAISQHLSSTIKKAEIPDRAFDMHTLEGRRKGRGLEYFFDEAATVKNERFPNDWEKAGRNAYLCANEKGLGKAVEIIKAIKRNYEKSKKSQKLEEIYN